MVTLVQVNTAFVRPHLEFSDCVWSPSLKKDIEIIENIQRWATKLVLSVSHFSYPDRLVRLNLPTLSYRRARGDMIKVFKTTSHIYSPKVTKFFTCRDHTVTRGSQIKKIHQPFCHSSIRHNFISILISKILNSLPQDVVEASGFNVFRNRLDKHW